MNLASKWWKALASWWERQRPFRKKAYGYRCDEFYVDTPIFTERVDLWHAPKRYERQVMPNEAASTATANAVTSDHGAVETSDDFSHFYAVQPPPNPLAERRARAEELLRKLHE